MRSQRPLAIASILSLPLSCLVAQADTTSDAARTEQPGNMAVEVVHEQPGAATAKLTIWVSYPEKGGVLLDQQQYLEDLAARFRDRGLAIAIVLPKADAAAVLKSKPRVVVAAPTEADQLDDIRGMSCGITVGTSGDTKVVMRSLDTLVDTVEACLDGTFDSGAHQQAEQALQSLLNNVADGGQFTQQVKNSLAMWPRSGRAHACAVLDQWWCHGDLNAAQKAIDDGIKALGNEAVPMATFVDLVLRGDDADKRLAQRLAMAMAPVAASANGTKTQLIYLRALLCAQQDRVAGRIVATLPKRLAGQAHQQLVLAETLMESSTPNAFRDLAERLIQNADANGGNRKWVYATRHKMLKRCGDDKAAAQLMDEYRAKNIAAGLNNDAWYTIIQEPTMGRFDSLALAQCEQMQRVEQVDYGSLDTIALAHFVNGKVKEAIEMQTKAAQASQNDPVYVARLRRYKEKQAAIEARQANKR